MTKQRTIAPPPVLTALQRPDAGAAAVPTEQAPGAGVGRDYRTIDVHLISANPFAPREVYTPSMLLIMAEALRTQGQRDPIHVIPNPDIPGCYIIADGWTRTTACIEHKVLPALLAEVHADLSLEDAAWYGYLQNEERQQHCDLDRAMFYQKMMATGETQEIVAKRAKLHISKFKNYLAFARLHEDILKIAREHSEQFSYKVAYPLRQLEQACGVPRAVALADRFFREEQTIRWLENQVQLAIHPSGRKVHAASKHMRYNNGYLKQRGEEFQMQIAVSPEKRDAFATALEALLATVAINDPGDAE